METISITDSIINKFFRLFFNIFNKDENESDIDIIVNSYLQSPYLIDKKFLRGISGVNKEELLLFDLKEALYNRDFDKISRLISIAKCKEKHNPVIDVFIFSSDMLLLSYKGDLDAVEKNIEQYLSKFKKQFHERLSLYIYSFILFFYPNIPFRAIDLIQEDDLENSNDSSTIVRLSNLVSINNSLKRYDKAYFYLRKVIRQCLIKRDFSNYLLFYDYYFFHEFIRGDTTDIFLPLEELKKQVKENPEIRLIILFYRLMFDYLNGFTLNFEKALGLFEELNSKMLYPYLHKLSVIMLACGFKPAELFKLFPVGRIFCDICFIEGYFNNEYKQIPLFLNEELRPIVLFEKIKLNFSKAAENGIFEDNQGLTDISNTLHHSIYQSCGNVMELWDNFKRCKYDKVLNFISGMKGISDLRNAEKDIYIQIFRFFTEKSLLLNTKLFKVFGLLSEGNENLTDEYITREFSREEKNLFFTWEKSEIKSEMDIECYDDEQSLNIDAEELNSMVGVSQEMISIKKKLLRFSKFSYPVLIIGESGTGKELIARAIHLLSKRKGRFIPINCSAIPENLFESELFGFKKGAFSGATYDKKGLIESAEKGTLFLDEIGDLPYSLQSKMLRFLQEGEILSIGDNINKRLDVRIVAATNVNIEEEIEKRNFRNDLYQRLNVFSIYIKPLRDRKDDISHLFRHFLEKYSNEFGITRIINAEEVISIFEKYDWPGNIRELENEMIRIFAQLGGESYIRKDYISRIIHSGSTISSKECRELNYTAQAGQKPQEEDIIDAWYKLNKNVSKTAEVMSVTRQWIHKILKKHNLS